MQDISNDHYINWNFYKNANRKKFSLTEISIYMSMWYFLATPLRTMSLWKFRPSPMIISTDWNLYNINANRKKPIFNRNSYIHFYVTWQVRHVLLFLLVINLFILSLVLVKPLSWNHVYTTNYGYVWCIRHCIIKMGPTILSTNIFYAYMSLYLYMWR